MSPLNSTDALMILSCLRGLGGSARAKLLAQYSPEEIFTLSKDKLPLILQNYKESIDLPALKSALEKIHARFIPADNFPNSLCDLSDAPLGLFARGSLSLKDFPVTVGIVGTRRPTSYGKAQAAALAESLAQAKIPVISGLALGIDTAAHQGALAAGGPTVAVLGTSVDVCYPSENKSLFTQIAKEGLLLSESPLGTQAERYLFPRRNRIIAALSTHLVVIESDLQGGAMITARLAQKLHRSLWALPGRIDQPTALGPNSLLAEGAKPLTSIDAFVAAITTLTQASLPLGTPASKNKKVHRSIENLSTEAQKLLSLLSDGQALGLDDLAEHIGAAPHTLLPALLQLELQGYIAKNLEGAYERV